MPRRPVPLAIAVGAAAVVLGATLTMRPFASLDALVVLVAVTLAVAGLGEILAASSAPAPRAQRLVGGLLVLTGVVALAVPGLTVAATATVVGIGLTTSGAARVLAGLRGDTDERYSAVVGGAAGVVLGVLALTWPDVTVLLIALFTGPIAIVLGAGQIVRAVRPASPGAPVRLPRARRAGRTVRATAALGLVAILVPLSAWIHETEPRVDAFTDAPAQLPGSPGALVRSEPFDRAMPEGSIARRILFTTTDVDGRVRVGSGLVVAPAAARDREVPVVLWTHGTTGVDRSCAPSLLPDPFKAGGMPAVVRAVEEGWAIVAPDYPGLGTAGDHPYLIGRPNARAALDAVRAARTLDGLRLGERTVVWGHSQGGGVALWTGIEQRRYAPDVPLSGVAALAPASALRGLAAGLTGSPVGSLFAAFVVRAYAARYPDVEVGDYVRATARPTFRAFTGRCLAERSTLLSIASALSDDPIFTRSLASGPLAARLAENEPRTPSGVPTLLAQGLADTVVLPAVQRRYVRDLCRAGQDVDFRPVPRRDHLAVVADDSPLLPELLRWTAARFAGERAAGTC